MPVSDQCTLYPLSSTTAAGMDLHRLRQLYFEMKETVFRRKSKVMNQVCDTKALEALLHRTFEEKMMMSETKPK